MHIKIKRKDNVDEEVYKDFMGKRENTTNLTAIVIPANDNCCNGYDRDLKKTDDYYFNYTFKIDEHNNIEQYKKFYCKYILSNKQKDYG